MLEHFFCDDWLENKMFYLFSFSAQNFNWKFGIKNIKGNGISFPPSPSWAWPSRLPFPLSLSSS